jgi:peptidoglycan/xylan/chitin deacetylase (PgdA/CDA1 family)
MSKKLIFKKAVSNLLFYPSRVLNDKRDGFRVLNYHSITDSFAKEDHYQMTTPRGLFEMQLGFLSENGYNVVSCDEAVKALTGHVQMPPRAVCITFDDGFKDNMTYALPVLKRFNYKATIFLTTGFIGKSREYLDWDDVKYIMESGVFSAGGHSLSHKKLSTLSPDELSMELTSSKKVLEDQLKRPVDLFAYPFGCYGSFDARVKDLLRSSGYKAAFTTIAGFNTRATGPFEIRRTRISWFDDKREFLKELSGAYDWYKIWQKISTAI